MAFQVVKLGEYCFVVGGCKASRENTNYDEDYEDSRAPEVNVSKKVFKYDPKENKWENLEDMPIGRYNHSCFVYQKKIVVIGGQDGQNKLVKPIEMYDPEQNSWSTIGEMKWSRIHFASALYLDTIWLIGGIKKIDVGPTSVVESFNLETGEWHRQPPLPSPTMNSAAVAWRDQLFNIGGREKLPSDEYVSTDKISMYKAMDNIWQVIASISVPRHNLNALIANERVYILGGEQRVSDEVRIAFYFFLIIDDFRLALLESFLSSASTLKTSDYLLLFRPCHCIQDSRHLSLFDYCIYSSVF